MSLMGGTAFFYESSGKNISDTWRTQDYIVVGLGLTVCVFIILANILVITAIFINRRFHYPIYFLLGNLAAADLFAGIAYLHLMFHTGPWTQRLTRYQWFLRQASYYILQQTFYSFLLNFTVILNSSFALMIFLSLLFLFSGCFVICWTPGLVLLLLDGVNCGIIVLKFEKYFLVLAEFNSLMNPIIYSYRDQDMRRTFKRILCCLCPRAGHKGQHAGVRFNTLDQEVHSDSNGTQLTHHADASVLQVENLQ
uniref:Lysophosphatidic acid receptor 2b n=1 Tax=Astyanax mexicanus TaxID=7994 RepID=A0A8B9I219_ASTMX